MKTNNPEIHFLLKVFNRFMFVVFGAMMALGGMLLFTAFLDLPRHHDPGFAWFAVWVAFELSTIAMGTHLLVSMTWQQLPMHARRGTIVGLFSIAWFGVLEFVVWLYLGDLSGALSGLLLRILLIVVALGVALVWLSRRLARDVRSARLQDALVQE